MPRGNHDDDQEQLQHGLAAEIPGLRRYARALLCASGTREADDLVHACLEQALKDQALPTPKLRLRTSLLRTLHHLALAREQRGPQSAAGGKRPLDCDDRGTYAHFEYALMRLPLEQRAVILLIGLEKMTYREAAQVLQVTPGVLRTRLARSRRALLRALAS